MKNPPLQETPGRARRIASTLLSRLFGHAQQSYSQEGEDLILARLFEAQKTGFYVDVGAHHPTRFSNTQHFYERGWHGINIEPNPEVVALFRRHRKRDANVCCGVAENEGRMQYFMFNDSALNSLDRALAESRQGGRYKIIGTKEIPVRRLSAILEEFLPERTHIDFMSVDVEGYDVQVLMSNDWSRFKPTCMVVESVGFDLADPVASPIHNFLTERGYGLFAKTVNSIFYLDRNTDPKHRSNGCCR